jgi:hypothetical protein
MDRIMTRIAKALVHMQDDGRKPARLLLGHREAAEVEAEMYRRAGVVCATADGSAIFGVPVERVDQPDLLGVIAEGDA